MPYKYADKKREANRRWRDEHPNYSRDYNREYRSKSETKQARAHYRKQYAIMLMNTPEHPSHGTKSGYTNGCRCERCTVANREYQRAFRARERREADAL